MSSKNKLVLHGKIVVEVFEHPTDPDGSTGSIEITGCQSCLIKCLADNMAGNREFAQMILEASRLAIIVGKTDPR